MTDDVKAALKIANEEQRFLDVHNFAGTPVHNAMTVLAAEVERLSRGCQTCVWVEGEDGEWHTDCGLDWYFDEGGPDENRMVYCPCCGKLGVWKPRTETP